MHIERKAMLIRWFDIVIFAIGLLFSMIMIFWLDDAYHKVDATYFLVWARCLSRSFSNIYIECACNYPFLGMLSSAGVIHILKSLFLNLEPLKYIELFRYVLAFIDGANILLVYFILRTLSVHRSLFWAGLIGFLPSSWVGGALWGQIDGITQFFLLAFLLYHMRFLASYDKANPHIYRKIPPVWYVIGSSVITVCLLLMKQLVLFSVPVLVLMVLVTIYLCFKKDFLLLSSTFMALVVIGVFLPDLFLHLREGWFSHFLYILFGGRTTHGSVIGAGFNIWVFLGGERWSPSNEPFFSFLTPLNTGMFLFLSYELFLFGSIYRWLRQNLISQPSPVSYQEIFLILLFLLALTNLSFNVLLSGSHMRYLYHFYPFVLITYLGLRQTSTVFSRNMLSFFFIGSVLYGVFVWEELGDFPILFRVITSREFLAVFHLGLLCFLTTVYVRHQRFTINQLK